MPAFAYQVDNDTANSCLAIVARAAERVARGESAFMGEKRNKFGTNSRAGKKHCTKRSAIRLSLQERERVLEAIARGESNRAIAERFALHPKSGLHYRAVARRRGLLS